MKKKKIQDLIITIITIGVFAGLIALLLLTKDTGKAVQKPEEVLENKFRAYFLISAAINYQTNNAILSIIKNPGQKTIQEQFQCDSMLKNIEQAKKLREEIMHSFSYLHELNCFSEFTESDMKKYALLENQCRSSKFNEKLPDKIIEVYDYQKKALNSGCIKQTQIFDILKATQIQELPAR